MADEEGPDPFGGSLRWARHQAHKHRRGFRVGTGVAGLLIVIATSVLRTPARPTTQQHIVNGLVGVLVAVAVLVPLSVLLAFVVAPVQQRNELRRRFGKRFDPHLRFECLTEQKTAGGVMRGKRTHTGLYGLWVRVWNEGRNETYRTSLQNFTGLDRHHESYGVGAVPWEGKKEERLIPGPKSFARIELGETTRDPATFWFFETDGNENFVGHQLEAADASFDLVVSPVGESDGGEAPYVRRLRLTFDVDGRPQLADVTPAPPPDPAATRRRLLPSRHRHP